jgi:L-threonylcarbamoyladenylate synthase
MWLTDNEAMTTRRLYLEAGGLNTQSARAVIAEVASIWWGGGTVAFPTETVYGLGAAALDAVAVGRIFEAKQRPPWDPLIVHIADSAMLHRVVAESSTLAERLMKEFWPGPLTLLLPRSENVPDAVTAGRPLVGVRMPAHPVAHALIAAAGVPIAAPSANSFGRISPTTAAHVLEDLDGRIDAIVDGGATLHGVESTVVDASQLPMVVYRPGAIAIEELRAVTGDVIAYAHPRESEGAEGGDAFGGLTREALPSPGTGERHYAPRAKLWLCEVDGGGTGEILERAGRTAAGDGRQVFYMLPFGVKIDADEDAVFRWGTWEDMEELAQRLFLGLRELDRRGATDIICPLPPDQRIGTAIRDRLQRAARR